MTISLLFVLSAICGYGNRTGTPGEAPEADVTSPWDQSPFPIRCRAMDAPHIVASGIPTGEGPCWRSEQQDLVVTSVAAGVVYLVDPSSGQRREFANTAGGPNGAVLCADGGALITQNGGLDWSSLESQEAFAKLPSTRWTAACVQRIHPDGTVTTFAGDNFGCRAPNDIVVAPDNSVVFTDPVRFDLGLGGRVIRASGANHQNLEVLDQFDHYLNGIAVAPDGRLCTAEHTGLRWLSLDGQRDWHVERLPGDAHVDGFTFDANGWIYACSPGVGLFLFDAEGKFADQLPLPEGAVVLNCCFGGSDLRTLFVTDAGNRTVLAFESMPVSGFAAPALS